MRRPFTISSFALAAALVPGMLPAQATTPAQPPVGQQPAGQPPTGQPPATETPAQPTPPATPKLTITTPAGALLVPIKPDQTAVVEEFARKIQAGLAKTQDPALKQQAAGFKIFKSAEPIGANALFVVMIEPAVPNAEYDLFDMLRRTMTPEELRAPETAAMWKRYVEAFAAGPNRLSLTPIGQ